MSDKWIDVKDRLPDINMLVLAWIVEDAGHHRENGCVLAQYKGEKWEWQAFGTYCPEFTKTEITHWQELPELAADRR